VSDVRQESIDAQTDDGMVPVGAQETDAAAPGERELDPAGQVFPDGDNLADVGTAGDPWGEDAGDQDDPDQGADGDSTDDADRDQDGDGDNPLDTEAEIAADYLEELLDIADLDGDIDTFIEGDRAHVSIVSESEILVGDNGEVLDALQELARLAVMSETGGRSRLMLDVAGYRDRRRKELVDIAYEAVAEAKATNSRVPLAPMNPFERKIVHDAVVTAGLTSASEGEEPERYVVIHPA